MGARSGNGQAHVAAARLVEMNAASWATLGGGSDSYLARVVAESVARLFELPLHVNLQRAPVCQVERRVAGAVRRTGGGEREPLAV